MTKTPLCKLSVEEINSLSESEQRNIVRTNPTDIQFIDNPTDKVINSALCRSRKGITKLINKLPNEAIIKGAVNDVETLSRVDKWTPELQQLAIVTVGQPEVIKYIGKMCFESIISCAQIIEGEWGGYIRKWLDAMPIIDDRVATPQQVDELIVRFPFMMKKVASMSEMLELTVVNGRPSVIKRLACKSEEAMIKAVSADYNNIEYIKKPTPRVQIAAFNNAKETAIREENEYYIRDMLSITKYQCAEIKRLVVEYDPSCIDSITRPPLDVQMIAAKSGFGCWIPVKAHPKVAEWVLENDIDSYYEVVKGDPAMMEKWDERMEYIKNNNITA